MTEFWLTEIKIRWQRRRLLALAFTSYQQILSEIFSVDKGLKLEHVF